MHFIDLSYSNRRRTTDRTINLNRIQSKHEQICRLYHQPNYQSTEFDLIWWAHHARCTVNKNKPGTTKSSDPTDHRRLKMITPGILIKIKFQPIVSCFLLFLLDSTPDFILWWDVWTLKCLCRRFQTLTLIILLKWKHASFTIW